MFRYITVLWLLSGLAYGQNIKVDYQGFTLWVNCEENAAERFEYMLDADIGDLPRPAKFTFDPFIPKVCQQTSTDTYKIKNAESYQRGHLIGVNHFDDSEKAMRQLNYMVNIVPQTREFNTGAWYRTEYITECYRDVSKLLIIGGVFWGENQDDDYFLETHDIKTPGALWKLIYRYDTNNVIAWIIPNNRFAVWDNLDEYLVNVDTLEYLTNEFFYIDPKIKLGKPNESWPILQGCQKD